MTKTHPFLPGKRSIAVSHPEIFSGSLLHSFNLSYGMPKRFRHDKNIKQTNFYPIKEALACHPEIFSGSLFQDHSLSGGMPKKFRHDKNTPVFTR
ncbi:MAG: hypothetical protein V5804_06120 [Mucilaginibacter sp.]|uniref:hypothetical protein n=1 Tax=Mucilaginibacter sp. TaxID=1882438 RepID=UPI0034E58F1D